VFRANVHKRIVDVNGEPVRMAICTRCLRTQLKVTG
jgi:ribosomal protein L28